MSAVNFPMTAPEAVGFAPDLAETIDRVTDAALAEGRIVCADIIVARHGQVAYYRQHGYKNRETRETLPERALFRMASMTKVVSAVAVLIQQERGLLSVDDPVSKYIPEFANAQVAEYTPEAGLTGSHPAARDILIRDLLTHSSGLGSGAYSDSHFGEHRPVDGQTLADKVPEYGKLLLDFDPGSYTYYSGLLAFDTLLHIVERTSGMPIRQFLQENIFDPLGMTDTTFAPTPEQWDRVVEIYAWEDGVASRVDMGGHVFGNLPASYHSGGAGLMSTLPDYFRFASMLLNGGELGGARILRPETVADMGEAHLPLDLPGADPTCSWGWGVRVPTVDNGSQAPLPVGAFGWSGAYGTHFWVDRRNDLCVVYLSNMTTAGGSGALTAREIEKCVYDALK